MFIYAAVQDLPRKAALKARGATIIYKPGAAPGTENKVDLTAMLRDLAAHQVNEVHVEAGHKLNGSFIREGLVDEFLVYLAPMLIGLGSGMAHFGPFTQLSEAIKLRFHSVEPVGPDLRLLARAEKSVTF